MAPRPLAAFGLWVVLSAAAPPVSFAPIRPDFAPAADEYRRIWGEEGARIAAALEAVTGFAFPATPIEVLVSNGASMTAFDRRSMRLRSSYPPDQKRAVLVHEMGHRLAFTFPKAAGLDDHRLLYLFLYDVWADLYGPDFADRMARIERGNVNTYDYDAAWSWALSMSRAERRARLKALRSRAGV